MALAKNQMFITTDGYNNKHRYYYLQNMIYHLHKKLVLLFRRQME